MTDVILVGILLGIVGGAVFYIVKEKKKGIKCIGCPSAGSCGRKTGCQNNTKKNP